MCDRDHAPIVPCVLYCCAVLCCATDLGYFSHVTLDHPFQDSGLFYRFAEDAKTGGVAADASGQKVGGTNAQQLTRTR